MKAQGTGCWEYYRECCREGLQLSGLSFGKIAGGVIPAVIAAVIAAFDPLHIVSKQSAFHSFVDRPLSFIIYLLVLFLSLALFVAPYVGSPGTELEFAL